MVSLDVAVKALFGEDQGGFFSAKAAWDGAVAPRRRPLSGVLPILP